MREVCEAGTNAPHPRRIAIGIGDDAAVWQASRSHRSAITTDVLVDGVHFISGAMTPGEIGHRAMAANLSDLAAMGARPTLAVVALGLPPQTEAEWVLAAYRALAALAARHGATIAGGDLSRAPVLTLAIAAVGEVSARRTKRRSGGRPGDVLATTGPLGASRAGLEILRTGLAVSDDVRAEAHAAFATPQPRVREGRWLAASAGVHAMMDCSDGLALDAGRMVRASGCGATIERVPVHPAALAVAAAAGADPEGWALAGGEDFELIVAVAPRAFPHLAAAFARRFGRPLERVGVLAAGEGLKRNAGGALQALPELGWDHLAGLEPAERSSG